MSLIEDFQKMVKRGYVNVARKILERAIEEDNEGSLQQFIDKIITNDNQEELDIMIFRVPLVAKKIYKSGKYTDNFLISILKSPYVFLIQKVISGHPELTYKSFEIETYDLDISRYYTAFTFACKKGRMDVVEYFLSIGIDINYKGEEDFFDPAIIASLENLDILRKLLDQGADPNTRYKTFGIYNGTALHVAAHKHEVHPDAIDILLVYGADPTILSDQQTPAIFRCRGPNGAEKMDKIYKHSPETLFYVRHFKLVFTRDITVLHDTLDNSDYFCTKYALEKGCDPRIDNNVRRVFSMLLTESQLEQEKSDPEMYPINDDDLREYSGLDQSFIDEHREYIEEIKTVRLILTYTIKYNKQDRIAAN